MSHAGDITPAEAYDLLEDEPDAILVDVRTTAEWTYVGVPDLSGLDKSVRTIEWDRLDGSRNPAFIEQLRAEGIAPGTPLLFLCRSGARSAAAANAVAEEGFTRAHNVVGGFEGDLDGERHRGNAGGWKASGLPWVQS